MESILIVISLMINITTNDIVKVQYADDDDGDW